MGHKRSVMMELRPRLGTGWERRAELVGPRGGCVAATVPGPSVGVSVPFPVSRSEAIPRGDYFPVVRTTGCEESPHHLGMFLPFRAWPGSVVLPHFPSQQPPHAARTPGFLTLSPCSV